MTRRRKQAFKSTLEFESDYPVLPTYLPIEEGAHLLGRALSLEHLRRRKTGLVALLVCWSSTD